jgi:quercetin dioxygenase-like cupin family protein
MKKSFARVVGLAIVAVLVFTAGAVAQETYPDQFEAGPNIYKQIFENERVRVSEILFNPGDKIAMHTHAYDHFVYIMQAGQLTLSYPDGKTSVVDGAVSQVMWIAKESHAAENTGQTTLRALVVELKS